jgi:hypothetical protein
MLPLETKQSKGKLLPHLDLWGGSVSRGSIAQHTEHTKGDEIRYLDEEVGCGYVDWIGLAQDRDRWWTLLSAVMNLRVP